MNRPDTHFGLWKLPLGSAGGTGGRGVHQNTRGLKESGCIPKRQRAGELQDAVATSVRAFSLIELLIVMTLLSFIVLGLLAVLNQTQRAFKVGMSQVDVLEGGRATMDLIVRDVEEMAAVPGFSTNLMVNCLIATPAVNREIYQELPGVSVPGQRTNIIQDFFFLSRVNQEVIGTGYVVPDATNGMGTLYRYTTNVSIRNLSDTFNPYQLFLKALNNNFQDFSRVSEGVIHFRVQAYGTNGFLLDPFYDRGVYTNITVDFEATPSGTFYRFVDDALPLAVEIELGIEEPDVVDRIQALPSSQYQQIRTNYLATEAGKEHLFKQRVPIRRADPKVYIQ